MYAKPDDRIALVVAKPARKKRPRETTRTETVIIGGKTIRRPREAIQPPPGSYRRG